MQLGRLDERLAGELARAVAREAQLEAQLAARDAALALAGKALEVARGPLVEAAGRWPERRDLQQVLSPVYCAIEAATGTPAIQRAVELDRARREVCEAALAGEAADDAERLYAATARLRALLDRDGRH